MHQRPISLSDKARQPANPASAAGALSASSFTFPFAEAAHCGGIEMRCWTTTTFIFYFRLDRSRARNRKPFVVHRDNEE